MRSNNTNGSRAAWARGFVAVFAVLAIGVASASPVEAAPFAYVTIWEPHTGQSTVSVINTATNTVMATVTLPVGSLPSEVAVAPDGKHAYVPNNGSNTVSVIDTATNAVVAAVPVGRSPYGVAVTPDGTHAYVTVFNPPSFDNIVS